MDSTSIFFVVKEWTK